jgi:hypothetical protein
MAIAILIGVIFLTNWGQNTPPSHPQDRPVTQFTEGGQ